MKRVVCLALFLMLILLGTEPLFALGRRALSLYRGLAVSQEAEGRGEVPEEEIPTLATTLYYRFGEMEALGMEHAQIDLSREETVATGIVQRLIDGPDPRNGHLAGVFPEGTRLLSVTSDGTTAYVTLNEAFLSRPDGAPEDWEDSALWQEEAALRRRLALQSMVLSLTEEARVQRVQLYVAATDDDIPMRLQLGWFEPEAADTQQYLGACGRDEGIVLTAHNALRYILSCWQQRDYAGMYALLSLETGESAESFSDRMEKRHTDLLQYDLSGGIPTADGKGTTLVITAKIRTGEGEEVSIDRQAVVMRLAGENWALPEEELDQLMIRE